MDRRKATSSHRSSAKCGVSLGMLTNKTVNERRLSLELQYHQKERCTRINMDQVSRILNELEP